MTRFVTRSTRRQDDEDPAPITERDARPERGSCKPPDGRTGRLTPLSREGRVNRRSGSVIPGANAARLPLVERQQRSSREKRVRSKSAQQRGRRAENSRNRSDFLRPQEAPREAPMRERGAECRKRIPIRTDRLR
jgi:hypothetical protein